MNISGHWEGFYVQNPSCTRRTLADSPEEERFPIEAWIEHDGSRFSGKMLDHRVGQTSKVSEAVEAYGYFTRLRVSRFLQRYPDATLTTTLNRESVITGSLSGFQISFTKRYLGNGRYVFTFGESTWETELPGLVYYKGVISDCGDRVEGHYRTSRNPLRRDSRVRQPFRLIRQAQ
jgi:hypothetical protein